jgi:SAM-dependent methyltransferase
MGEMKTYVDLRWTSRLTAARRALRPIVASWLRSAHREQLTTSLGPTIAGLEGRALDVGGGRSAPHDRLWGSKVRRINIDISDRERPAVIADAAALPFSDESMDAVVMCELLEHVPQPRRVVGEARRVLRPGGVLCGSVPFIMPVHGDPDDFYRYTAAGLHHILRDYCAVKVRGHGNQVGGAWKLLLNRYPILQIANPLVRPMSARPDERCPQGYTFVAVKPGPDDQG